MGRKALSIGGIMILHAVARGVAHGFEIQEETGLTSGTVYPTLERMQADGLVSSEWEDVELARSEKRPARRYYLITAEGKRVLIEGLARYGALAPLTIDGVTYPTGGGAA
jgi:DNA-binding PadR family transcriptional regulator